LPLAARWYLPRVFTDHHREKANGGGWNRVGRRGGDVRAPGGRESKQRDLALAGRARVGGGVQLNFYF